MRVFQQPAEGKRGGEPRLSIRGKVWIATAVLIALELCLIALAGHLLAIGEHAVTVWESRLLLVLGALAFLLVGFQSVLVAVADLMLLKPLAALNRGAAIMRATHAAHELELPRAHLLGRLADHVHGLGAELHAARGDLRGALLTGAVAEETRRTRLEQIVRELHEGIIVCDAHGRILLYNDAALRALNAHPALGLGRSIYRILDRAPIDHARGLLDTGGAEAVETAASEFQCAVMGAEIWLRCRVGPLRLGEGAGPESPGFLLALKDVTGRRREVEVRDTLLRTTLSGLRESLGALRATLKALVVKAGGEMAQEEVGEIVAAVAELEMRVDTFETDTRALVAAEWVSSDIYGGDLLRVIADGLLERHRIRVTVNDASDWLRVDSHAVAQLVEHIVNRASEFGGVREFEMATVGSARGVDIEIRWEGPGAGANTIAEWVAEALNRVPGGTTLAGTLVADGNAAEAGPFRPVVKLNFPASGRQQGPAKGPLPSRPEFYDFDLGSLPATWQSLADCDLGHLDYVVFDTETTGLRPSEGDEIVSIAGVRIVNGQIIQGETFDQLVNPGRHIPRASVRFHGITDERVADEPPVTEALKRFREYVGDAVLVAYNAAFDMKFLQMKETTAGVRFDNPVLDVLLLSVNLHDHAEDHTLDAIAARLGVEVTDRHTAIGDAMTTAGIYLHLMDLLPGQGIRTLGEAAEVSMRAVEIRKRQEGF